MTVPVARRRQIQALRALARAHEVGQVRDDAGRDTVLKLAAALRSKALEPDARAELAAAVAAYEATFADVGKLVIKKQGAASGR